MTKEKKKNFFCEKIEQTQRQFVHTAREKKRKNKKEEKFSGKNGFFFFFLPPIVPGLFRFHSTDSFG
jgi:hypothetical protein